MRTSQAQHRGPERGAPRQELAQQGVEVDPVQPAFQQRIGRDEQAGEDAAQAKRDRPAQGQGHHPFLPLAAQRGPARPDEIAEQPEDTGERHAQGGPQMLLPGQRPALGQHPREDDRRCQRDRH